MRKLIWMIIVVCLSAQLSAVAMRASADGRLAWSHFAGDINSIRAESSARLEVGEELGDRHDIMLSFSSNVNWQLDTTDPWTSIPPHVSLGIGVAYSYDFSERFGLKVDAGVNLGNYRLVDDTDSFFYAGITPYISMFTFPENYSSYELIFPVEMAFSGSRIEVKAGLGVALHIASRYGEEYVQ